MKDLSNENVVHIRKEGIEYLQFRKLLKYSNLIEHCFTLRNNNLDFSMHWEPEKYKSTVIENYKRICFALNIDYKNICRPWQTHTANVVNINEKIKKDEPDVGLEELKNIDGAITNKRNIILSTTNADCILFLLFDPVKKVIANVHSGWKGTFQKIGEISIKKMISDYNCNPADIICCICPCISKEMFCVHEDVEKPCKDIFSYTGRTDEFIKIGEMEEGRQKYYIDTVLINKIMLMDLGIKEENFIESKICSVKNVSQIHSKRGSNNTFFGVNTALIELR